jgi:hypothetical protein
MAQIRTCEPGQNLDLGHPIVFLFIPQREIDDLFPAIEVRRLVLRAIGMKDARCETTRVNNKSEGGGRA